MAKEETKTLYKERYDKRNNDETREMEAEVGVIPNADGSASFSFGKTKAIAAVYGPKTLHPQHLQNPKKGLIRCYYDMMSFSVTERKRPGPGRRGTEISKVIGWAFEPVINTKEFPGNVVDIYIIIPEANASTRCASINAATMALAHAGVPMKEMVASVSIGKVDKTLVVDLTKKEEDFKEGEGSTDIPLAFTSKNERITLFQLDGKISGEELKQAIKLGKQACRKINEVQKQALKKINE